MADSEVSRRNLYSRYSDDTETTLGDTTGVGVEGGGVGGGTGIQWEERQRTLKDIVQNGKYPCLVKVKSEDVETYAHTDGRTGQREVLHVLELRRHKMVVAAKLQWDRRSGEYLPTGRQSEVNVTQKGSCITTLT